MKLTQHRTPLFGKKIILPAGTPLQLKTTHNIYFNQARQGESFTLKLTEPVLSPDTQDILIRSDAEVTAPAVIDEHETHKAFGALCNVIGFLTGHGGHLYPAINPLSGDTVATLQFKHGRAKAVDGTTVPFTSSEKSTSFLTQPVFTTAPPWTGVETLPAGVPITAQTTKDVIVELPEPETKLKQRIGLF